MANALTIARIVLSLALLVPPALSLAFLALYAIAGATDMPDGFVVYLVPFALPLVGVAISAIPACAVATFAAIQEGHLIRTGRAEPSAQR